MLVLAMVLAITLAVTTPALASNDFATATPIPGYPDFEITDKGVLIHERDVIVGKCGSSQRFAFQSASLREEAARACEKAGYSASLAKTGGLPVILVPIALLVVGGLLIRKSTAR
jgi:hypothetical protein